MGYYAADTKDAMLNAITVDILSLHTDNPGAAGGDDEYDGGGGYERKAATFNASAGSGRILDADVTFDGVAGQSIAWIGLWEEDTSDVFHGAVEPTGDKTFNSEGKLIVKAGSVFNIVDV